MINKQLVYKIKAKKSFCDGALLSIQTISLIKSSKTKILSLKYKKAFIQSFT